jgi:hypothetical protein
MGWAPFMAFFSQTHLVTLVPSSKEGPGANVTFTSLGDLKTQNNLVFLPGTTQQYTKDAQNG